MTTAAIQRLAAIAVAALTLFLSANLDAATHKVRKGDTLSSIAKKYDITLDALKRANKIANPNQIRIGQTLEIPNTYNPTFEYTIKKGESLSSIAKKHRIKVSELARLNGIRNVNKIKVGQVVKIPGLKPHFSTLTWSTRNALSKIPVRGGWKNIVIHHSATMADKATNMDRVHREERRMENGLAYHFVIGNGRGMGDGEVYIGNRWRRQIQGGHLKSTYKNEISIGICLVGNFEKQPPTRRQLAALESLIRYLLARTEVHPTGVTTHTIIHPNHTLCPGRHFPTDSFLRKFD